MGIKKWHVQSFDRTSAKKFAAEAGVSPLLAVLLQTRGVSSIKQAEEMLSDDISLSDPLLLPDMAAAVERIRKALDDFEKIAVYGDYDADGVTATAMVYSYLEASGGNVIYYIPDREKEGYGLNKNAVDALHSQGVKLILTVDNGISSAEEVDYAKKLGIDTIITDHHQPGDTLPKAVAVVDAWRKDCSCPYRSYSGAGVAFKLLTALEGPEGTQAVIENYTDLAAIGTIGDVVPLTGENRMLVKYGLKLISRTDRIGLKSLLELAGVEGRQLTAETVAFTVVPRINATGRIGTSDCAVRLLVTESPEEAGELAAQVCRDNGVRRQTEDDIFSQAMEKIYSSPSIIFDRVMVVAGEGWHQGVIGIVASKITECFGKPCIVVSCSGKEARGSGRSIEGFSLFDAVWSCRDLLTRFGGHPMAAGMSLPSENVEKLRERINQYAASLGKPMPVQVLSIDCLLKPDKLSVEIPKSLKSLEPFGAANPHPLFGLFGMTIGDITPVGGGKHLRVSVQKGTASVLCMKFGTTLGEFPYKKGNTVDMAVKLQVNSFNGMDSLTVVIREMRFAGTDEDALIKGQALYEKFRRGEQLTEQESTAVLPNRSDCVSVYRVLRSMGEYNGTLEDLFCRIEKGSNFAEFLVIMDIFSERGLISRVRKRTVYHIQVVPNHSKVCLAESPIIKSLHNSNESQSR